MLMKTDWSSKLIARVMGITDKRSFPVFSSVRAKPRKQENAGRKTVIFLSDVFSRYLEPQVAQAAFDILDYAGFDIKVLRTVGAGASFLSKGFIDQARSHAEKVLDEIKALGGGAIVSVVGCEPPEVYCLKHEYVGLLPERRAEIESIAQNVWLVEEFVLRVGSWVGLGRSGEERQKITFHPHCHQRAEGLADDGLPLGTSATVEMLRMAGFDVDLIDAGCCGMAGTFGYDAEHYELSMQIGELGVLPKVRGAESVVSTGSACRIQIKQGTGIAAKHPLELVRDALIKQSIASVEKKL
jgi:Fe-S oxidoreductase